MTDPTASDPTAPSPASTTPDLAQPKPATAGSTATEASAAGHTARGSGTDGSSGKPLDHYTGADKIIITALIIAFSGFFVWLWYQNETTHPTKTIFLHFWFVALITVVLAGILRATGTLKTDWIVLGGSVAVFAGLLWMTGGWQGFREFTDATRVRSELNRQIADLKSAHGRAIDELKLNHGREITKLNGKNTELDEQNSTLRLDLKTLKEELAQAKKNQDLIIVARKARGLGAASGPVHAVRFRYSWRGNEALAEKLKDEKLKENRAAHAIPAAVLQSLEEIVMEYDPQSAPQGRLDEIDFEIERLNMRLSPLEIDIYVHEKKRGS